MCQPQEGTNGQSHHQGGRCPEALRRGDVFTGFRDAWDALDVIRHAPEAQLCCSRGHCTHTRKELHALQVPRNASPLSALERVLHCHAKQLSGAQESLSNSRQHHGRTLDLGTGGLASNLGH